MKYLKFSALTMMVAVLSIAIASAYNAVGSFNGWNNNDGALVMLDNGTNGDAVAGDNIFTCQTSIATAGSYEWKIVTTAGDWNTSLPSGSNSWFQTTTDNQVVKFYLDLNVDSTWTPMTQVLYTSAQVATTYTAVGMQTWLGHTQDWDNAYAAAKMHDDGLNGDAAAGDGIYTLRITFSTIDPTTTGAKSYKVALDNAWSHQIASGSEDGNSWGFSINGNNKSIASINSADTIYLYADSIKGRLKVSQSFVPRQGPPWYSIGDVQGSILNSLTLVNDSAANGDAVAGDGIFSRSFLVTFDSITHWSRITDEKGTRYPGSSSDKGCYYSAVSGDNVLFTFNTNTALDGWYPYTNYVYTSGAFIGSHTYTAVGDCQTAFGTLSDWDPSTLLTRMVDDGTNGDAIAGDSIYTYQGVIASTVTTLNDYHFKVALDGGWTLQIGNDGRSMNSDPGTYWFQAFGGDTVKLFADVVRGRIKAVNLNRNTHPQPVISAEGGNPGQVKTFTVSGGTIPYLAWSSSDTSVVQIQSFAGDSCVVKFGAIGSATITVYDGWGETGTKIVTTSATSAPLFKDWELMESKVSAPVHTGGSFEVKTVTKS
jgi:hypothetical protein